MDRVAFHQSLFDWSALFEWWCLCDPPLLFDFICLRFLWCNLWFSAGVGGTFSTASLFTWAKMWWSWTWAFNIWITFIDFKVQHLLGKLFIHNLLRAFASPRFEFIWNYWNCRNISRFLSFFFRVYHRSLCLKWTKSFKQTIYWSSFLRKETLCFFL